MLNLMTEQSGNLLKLLVALLLLLTLFTRRGARFLSALNGIKVMEFNNKKKKQVHNVYDILPTRKYSKAHKNKENSITKILIKKKNNNDA